MSIKARLEFQRLLFRYLPWKVALFISRFTAPTLGGK